MNILEIRSDMLEDLPIEVIQALEAADIDEDLSDMVPNDAIFQQFKLRQK